MGKELIIVMKHRSLQEAYTSIYRPRPRLSDYIPHENRLIILERKSPEEEDVQQKSTKLYNDIAEASNGLLRADVKPASNTLAYYKRKGARLALTSLGKEQTPESYNFDFVKQLATDVGATVDEVFGVPPTKQEKLLKKTGKQISLSSKFYTYYVSRDNITIPILICNRVNKGIELETNLHADFEKQLNGELQQGGLLEALLIKFNLVKRYRDIKIEFSLGKSERRTIGTDEEHIVDVGKKIADFTLVDTKTKKEYYISLKDTKGKTFANKGVSGIFKQTTTTDPETGEHSITVTPGNVNVLDKFFASITGDKDGIKEKICRGLEEYAKGVITDTDTPITTSQYYFENIPATAAFKQFVQTTIKSGLGYGYYYLKEKSKSQTQYIFLDLTTREKLDKFVSENIQIEHISMQFPYYASKKNSAKSFSLDISTKNGSTYVIDVRTKSPTAFVPSEFILSVTNFNPNPADKDEVILTVIPPR